MSESPNKFCWYELMTTDLAAAQSFYGTVVGWNMQDSGLPGMTYTILNAGKTGVGGMMTLPKEACDAGAQPGWIGYIAVDDVDAATVKLKGAGGAIHRPPDDIPSVGRFAVVADPQGANFVLFKPQPPAGFEPPPPPPHGTPGHGGWHELHAGDREAAFAFYASQFGWTKDQAVDMGGSVGVYQLFATGGDAVGGMMKKMDAFPSPFWLYYFIVDDIDAAAARVTGADGKILNGPHEVPGGTWIIQALDPQGAMFALVGPKR